MLLRDFCERNFSGKHIVYYILCIGIVAVFGASFLPAQSGEILPKDQKAIEAIAAAKKALGGEKNIDNIKSLILTGTEKQLQPAGNYSQHRFELKIMLPDNFIWITHMATTPRGASYRYHGVSNGELRSEMYTGTERAPKVVPQNFNMQTAANVQLDVTSRLLIGAVLKVLKSDPADPITILAIPDIHNRFSITSTRGMFVDVEFDPKDKYPSSVMYKTTVPPIFTAQPANSKPGSITIIPSSDKPEVVDAVIRFKDRVAVDGVMFPKNIIYENADGNVFRELLIEKVQINPKLSLKDFELPQ